MRIFLAKWGTCTVALMPSMQHSLRHRPKTDRNQIDPPDVVEGRQDRDSSREISRDERNLRSEEEPDQVVFKNP